MHPSTVRAQLTLPQEGFPKEATSGAGAGGGGKCLIDESELAKWL